MTNCIRVLLLIPFWLIVKPSVEQNSNVIIHLKKKKKKITYDKVLKKKKRTHQNRKKTETERIVDDYFVIFRFGNALSTMIGDGNEGANQMKTD